MPWLFPTSYHYHRFQCRQPKSIKPSNKQTNIKPQRPVNPPSIRDTSTSPTTAQIKVGRFQLGSPPPPPAALPLSRGHEWRAGGAPPIWVTAPEIHSRVDAVPGFHWFHRRPTTSRQKWSTWTGLCWGCLFLFDGWMLPGPLCKLIDSLLVTGMLSGGFKIFYVGCM